MIKVGLREANMHFSKYVKMARGGQEIVVTERGTAIAVIKPIGSESSPGKRIKALEEQGILLRPKKNNFTPAAPVRIKGKAVAETLSEERDER